MELLINTPADFRSKDELPLQIEHADFTFFPRIEVAIYKERPGCAVCLERSVGGNAGRAAAKGFFCAEIQKEPVLIFPGGEVQPIRRSGLQILVYARFGIGKINLQPRGHILDVRCPETDPAIFRRHKSKGYCPDTVEKFG